MKNKNKTILPIHHWKGSINIGWQSHEPGKSNKIDNKDIDKRIKKMIEKWKIYAKIFTLSK